MRAPDLHVIFTRNPDPMDAAGVGVDYIDVGTLKGTIGNQTYTVPESVDFTQYPVLALYSPTLDLVMSTATLR
ncbi:DM13 domain-containing protein [bacterium]|nr:DM13 domain-containing protein [bacterium]